MTEVVRDIADAGIRITLQVPDHWSEIRVDGVALVVAGRLEDNDQTLEPSLQIRVQPAPDAEAAAAAVAGVADVLTDAQVVFERALVDPDGRPETVAEVAHRNDITGATQISMFRTFYLEGKHLAVSVVASCGGAASQEARDRLREMVLSVRLGTVPG